MVKHQPLQVYERQLCLSCLTGIYGCRWKRYQRSHDDTTKWELLWSLLLLFTFCLLLVWFYFWWEAHNDYNEFNWVLYERSGEWSDGTVPILATTAAGFTYIAFLMVSASSSIHRGHAPTLANMLFVMAGCEQFSSVSLARFVLALCHVAVGQQLNLHWLHKIGVSAALLTTVVAVISVNQVWGEEWDVVPISLQATGPFLHIGALAAVTALSWIVASQVARAEKTRFQVVVLLLYLSMLLGLYLVPLSITSPCIMERSDLKPRPKVIGHQGAPMVELFWSILVVLRLGITHEAKGQGKGPGPATHCPDLAPENTLVSFQRALQMEVTGLEADVAISVDGVPFLMRDRTLCRTTDVEKVFPDRRTEDASFFNWTDLRQLNAGKWFLEDDPFWTVHMLSQAERWLVANQSVCSLQQLLVLAAPRNRTVVFRLRRPPAGHPRRHSWINDTLEAVRAAGLPLSLVMWTPDEDRERVRRAAPELLQTSLRKRSLQTLQQQGISRMLLRYNQASTQDLREFSESNVSVTLHTVNEPWLYSVLWCSGVPSVSSEAPQLLKKLAAPAWLMVQDERMRSYNPEQIMLSAAVRRSSRDVNIMKEKLILLR
ncbi:hypothetical protein CRUP_029866 [Coryphaenoides rupestris]|nr:hypothetical protein CRUP_029866 [Coryphaenoides rupestris]